MAGDDGFHEHELESIGAGLTEFASGEVVFQHLHVAAAALLELWQPGEPVTAVQRRPEIRERRAPVQPDVFYRRAESPVLRLTWDLGFSSEFSKAIASIDRKLQGRVLQALDYLSTKPTVPKGNTVKPLSGEHEGLWRYRIGDYRLIYRPDTDNTRVELITVVSRGSAYA